MARGGAWGIRLVAGQRGPGKAIVSDLLAFTGPLRPIDAPAWERARSQARQSPRRRAILRYHAHEEPLQRMLNAMEPGTYVRPHRHAEPRKLEIFLALVGSAWLVVFDDAGGVAEAVAIAADGPCRGAEILPDTWHAVVCAAPGTVLYELIEGAYHPVTHKDFAPWSPGEGDAAAGPYLAALEATLALHYPHPGGAHGDV